MKKVLILSDMILQPVGRFLRQEARDVEFAQLGAVAATLESKVEADYLFLILDNRFFYDLWIENVADALERLKMLEGWILGFRSRQKTPIVLANLYDRFWEINTGMVRQQKQRLASINDAIEGLKSRIADLDILDIESLVARAGEDRCFNRSTRYLYQSPWSREGARILAREMEVKMRRFEARRKKVLVLDGDNTLWGGIVGEDGVEGVACDANHPGIYYHLFQRQLLQLKESGIVLALVSKNNEADVRELFRKRSMPLKWEDFVSTRVNWAPKSENIASIAKELNLGLESFCFVDDNPFEIAQVESQFPGVECVRLDADHPETVVDLLPSIESLYAVHVTEEDRRKSEQYRGEKRRAEIFSQSRNLDDFIASLGIRLVWWKNNRSQLPRITQLINKTNQFNLTTRRYTQSEVEKMMEEDEVFSFKVEDRFGDMGVVGVLIVRKGHIDTFLLSCRVLGRRIEEAIMQTVRDEVTHLQSAEYIPSPKNAQVESLYERLGFECIGVEEDGRKLYQKAAMPKMTTEHIRIERGENG